MWIARVAFASMSVVLLGCERPDTSPLVSNSQALVIEHMTREITGIPLKPGDPEGAFCVTVSRLPADEYGNLATVEDPSPDLLRRLQTVEPRVRPRSECIRTAEEQETAHGPFREWRIHIGVTAPEKVASGRLAVTVMLHANWASGHVCYLGAGEDTGQLRVLSCEETWME